MLDNVLNSVRRGMERARVRGEEAYQATRLRLEIFNLGREQDTLFGRLGRAYHGGSDVAVLAQIQSEIRRVAEEIRSRELLIEELGRAPEEPEPAPTSHMAVSLLPPTAPTPPKENAMTDDQNPKDVKQTGEVQRDSAADANDTSDDTMMEAGLYGDPDSPDIPQSPLTDTITEAQQRREVHKNALQEGERATQNPDPLDKP